MTTTASERVRACPPPDSRPLTLLATCAILAACGGTEGSAVIVGTLDTGVSRSGLTSGESDHSARGTLQIEVDGENRTVDLGADGSFVVGELTQGNLSLSLTWQGIKAHSIRFAHDATIKASTSTWILESFLSSTRTSELSGRA